jgi:hypothetical protein
MNSCSENAMTDLATLQPLRDRVAAAQGPDETVDCWIENIFGLATYEKGPWVPDEGHIYEERMKPKPFTASIDAALGWVGRVLPGKCLTVQSGPQYKWAVVHEDTEDVKVPELAFFAPTAPLAIILAGLDALIAREKEKTDG